MHIPLIQNHPRPSNSSPTAPTYFALTWSSRQISAHPGLIIIIPRPPDDVYYFTPLRVSSWRSTLSQPRQQHTIDNYRCYFSWLFTCAPVDISRAEQALSRAPASLLSHKKPPGVRSL
jgi:hypothetical protein